MKKIAILLITLSAIASASNNYTEIGYKEVKRAYEAGSALFLDARDLKFYKKGTILGALSMPLDRFKRMRRLLPVKKGTKIITFCSGIKCEKSTKLAEKIAALGYSRVMVYRAGYPEWFEKGQDIMLSNKYCQKSKGAKRESTINGVKVYLGKDEGSVDAEWFAEQVNKGSLPKEIALMDVRRKKEFDAGHLPGALHNRWDPNEGKIDNDRIPKDKLVIFYCNSGLLSSDAYDSLDDETAKRVLFLNAVVKCKGEKCNIKSLDK